MIGEVSWDLKKKRRAWGSYFLILWGISSTKVGEGGG